MIDRDGVASGHRLVRGGEGGTGVPPVVKAHCNRPAGTVYKVPNDWLNAEPRP